MSEGRNFFKPMAEDKISVISLKDIVSNDHQADNRRSIQENQNNNEASARNMCHIFSVLTVVAVLLVPVTLIPRKNSIFYPSYWYEIILLQMAFTLLPAINDAINMATYFKENSILSFRMLFKMYLSFSVTWIVPCVIAYFIWCQYLKYNWPIPYLGYSYLIFIVVRTAAIWISFPRHLRSSEHLRRNFQMYIMYLVSAITFGVLREGISILFSILPGYLQWIVAFLIPLLKEFEIFVLARLVNKMAGGQEESSEVLLELAINSSYSFFIAVRLPNAAAITVCFIIIVDFFLLLQMTYQIVQLHNSVNNKTNESENNEKQRMVTKLVLSELTEGMTPVVYGIGIAMAYYGYNSNIIGNVKNGYWGFKPIDDIGYIFQMMLLLLGVDVFSTLINSFTLASLTNVTLFQEFYRIFKKYWHFIAFKFAYKMLIMFLIKDINFGIDATGKLDWITNDGRIKLINSSTDLSYEEKSLLLDQFVLQEP